MKEQLHEWEADIRRKVEQHEFDFEPEAWVEMEDLLVQTSSAGKLQNPPPGKGMNGMWWKLGIWSSIIAFVVITIGLWLSRGEETKPEIELSSFSVPVMPIPSDPGRAEAVTKMPVPIPLPLRTKAIPLQEFSLPKEVEVSLPTRPSWEPVMPLPTVSPKPLPERPMLRDTGWQLPPAKSKRDRRKLFPDIIERNK